MKRSLISMVLFAGAAAATYRMSDDAPSAVGEAVATVTKESLLQRIEDLFAKGVQGVENLLHDAISVVEEAFGGEDADEEAAPNEDAAATPTEAAAPADTGETPAA